MAERCHLTRGHCSCNQTQGIPLCSSNPSWHIQWLAEICASTSAGAPSGRPSRHTSPILCMCRLISFSGRYFVNNSAGFSGPAFLCTARSIVRIVSSIKPLHCCVHGRRAVDILLVPKTMHVQRRNQPARSVKPLVCSDRLPLGSVRRILDDPCPHFMAFVQPITECGPERTIIQH